MSQRDTSATFRQEAQELLAQLEGALLELEERPDAAPAIDQVFRAAHTLKGSGAMSGFGSVAEMAHELESAFDMVRSGCIAVSPELISLTLWVADFIKAAIEGREEEQDLGRQRVHAFVTTLRQICSLSRGENSTEAPAPAAPEPVRSDQHGPGGAAALYFIRFIPGPDIFARGIRPQLILAALAECGQLQVFPRFETIPLLAEIDPERCYLAWDLLLLTTVDPLELRDPFIFVEDDSVIEIDRLAAAPDQVEARFEQAGQMLSANPLWGSHELSVALAATMVAPPLQPAPLITAPPSPVVSEPRRAAYDASPTPPAATSVPQSDEGGSFLRVRADRLDALVNLVGELSALQGRLLTTAQRLRDPLLNGITEETERLTATLRRQVLQTRMVPIGTTFARFKRLIRDLAQDLGKDIDLVTSGEKTEIDKTMIDRLQDPLVHLVRNCIDHGIEGPAARHAAGKSPRGEVRMSASQRGSHVVIEIGDDGGGLDLERIRAKAETLGIIAAGEVLSERQLAELVFHPGLSTAHEVTRLSGRGVGMDAVKEAVLELRGSIEITSVKGVGTNFIIKLPLTLAIVEGLMVQAGKNRYVLPLTEVRECIELHHAGREERQRDLVPVRGELVPFVRLREQFALAGAAPAIEQVVIVEVRGERLGLAVDRVHGGHQMVIKGLGKLCGAAPGVSGATILGDGSVALTLDLHQLFSVAKEREKQRIQRH